MVPGQSQPHTLPRVRMLPVDVSASTGNGCIRYHNNSRACDDMQRSLRQAHSRDSSPRRLLARLRPGVFRPFVLASPCHPLFSIALPIVKVAPNPVCDLTTLGLRPAPWPARYLRGDLYWLVSRLG